MDQPALGAGRKCLPVLRRILEVRYFPALTKNKNLNTPDIMLPAKQSPAVFSPDEEAFSMNKPARGRRILLVDDDEVLRELVAEALIMSGYEVVCAEDGEAGWDSLCKLEFDLLITDHNMPRLSGFDLIKKLNSRPSQVPVIMITGYVPFQFQESANTLPFCDVLPKPFSFEELLQKVNRSLKLMEA